MKRNSTSREVGRPREVDEDAVLEAARDAFWQKGYEATSLADLCQCTGLHKGSLYQSFGDKHALFMRALQRYAQAQFSEVAAVAFGLDLFRPGRALAFLAITTITAAATPPRMRPFWLSACASSLSARSSGGSASGSSRRSR